MKNEKRKVAVMTWHHTDNYGTGFQAYALSKVIKDMGYEVDLIDYRRHKESPLKKRSLKDLVKGIGISSNNKMPTYSNYESFEDYYDKNFSYSPYCENYQELNAISKLYDGIVCGSDQIWSPDGLDEHYFLDFANKNKICAYAPSFGISSIQDEFLKKRIARLINRFRYVAIREKSGKILASNITGREDICNVLDPVLLLRSEEWTRLEKRSQKPNKPYMVVFFLKNNDSYFEKALSIAKSMQLKTCIMHSTQSEDNCFANIENPTPEELLDIMHNAAFVCTDSFHICVLSIIYNIQFCVFLKDIETDALSRNGRLIDLLTELELKDRIGLENPCETIDYHIVNKKLDILRNFSKDFLKHELENVTNLENDEINDDYCICEQKNNCKGRKECDIWLKKKKDARYIEKFFTYRMELWDFLLDEKCYECEHYKKDKINSRRPLFYDELINSLNSKSIISIYNKYYLAYDIPYIIKSLLRRR